MFDNLPSALPQIKSGNLRALAVTTADRVVIGANFSADVGSTSATSGRSAEANIWLVPESLLTPAARQSASAMVSRGE